MNKFNGKKHKQNLFDCIPLSMFTSPGNESRMIFVIFELGKFKSWMRSTILPVVSTQRWLFVIDTKFRM